MSVEGHEQMNILLLNGNIGHFMWRPENLCVYVCVCVHCCQWHKFALQCYSATLNICVSEWHVAEQHTHALLLFHCKSDHGNVPQCYIIHTLSVLFHVKICLALSLSIFSFSAVILMSKWWSHQSVYLFHIFISLHCYQTARSSGASTAFVI
jgi:hypothetical protein